MCSTLSGALALAIMGALAVVAVGVGSATWGVLAVAVGVVSATAGVLAVATGVVSAAAGVLAVAVGVVSATAGVLAVAVGVVSATPGVLAVAVAQRSEIIFTPVTTTLLSEEPELVATFVFCPMTSTSCPRCGFRSTALVVILKV
jgi:hypothetical protein